MTQLREIYKCRICGNLVEMVGAGAGMLVCCNQDMELLQPKTKDEGNEKHVPLIEKTEKGIKVKVGEVEHPMDEEHYITFIEVLVDGKVYRQEFNPGDKPEMEVCCVEPSSIAAREYCNVHGLWGSSK
ncbi:MAG: desulfoferrodoxin [Candidatus Dojkabacteria bacterium]|nr:desulfoferrodoxin [Candidatus Dojkabacteria bacterium]